MKSIITIAIVLFLAGCADLPKDNVVPSSVKIAPDLVLAMPQVADLGRPVEVSQLVTVHYGQQSFAFEVHIQATPEHFLFVGLDLMGRKMITIDWTKDKINYEKASWVPSELRPENILADIVLLYWPAAIVRQGLATSGGKLLAGKNSRTVMLRDKKIWRADYRPTVKNDLWSGKLHYRNLARGYEFDVQSAETIP